MLTLFVVLSAVIYRLVRFVVIDAIFDGPRDKVHGWLLRRKNVLALKVHEGLSCNACMSVWFSAIVVLGVDIYGVSIPLPAISWLACSTGALVFAIIIDPEDEDPQ